MSTRMVKHIISSNTIPLFAVVVASLISLSLLVIHLIGMDLWKVALLILLAWLPIFVVKTREIYRQYRWLAFFFVLLIAQSVHFTEHIAQMIQIHFLGLSGMQAHGIIGMLDLEWVHFIFDAVWVPLCVYILLFVYRKSNPWLWVLGVIVTWHAFEHVVIMSYYLRTGIVGSSGLLAQGGVIAGGLPLIRPDLHFLYNLIEETIILIAYAYQLKQVHGSAKSNVTLQISLIKEV